MDDDKTVLTPNLRQKEYNSDHTVLLQPGLRVSLLDAYGAITNQFYFSHQFTAGRSPDNDIVIQDKMVSRHHLQVKQEKGSWWIYDLNSANGIYVNNKLIAQKSRLTLPALILLGVSGISLRIESTEQKSNIKKQVTSHSAVKSLHQIDKTRRNFSKGELKARLLAKTEAENSGDYTRMVRRIIHEDRTVRGRSYQKVIWGLGFLFLLAVVLVAYQQIALSNARTMAIDMFYDIKTLEVSLSQAEIRLEESAEVLDLTMKVIVDEKFGDEQEKIKAEQEQIAMEKRRVAQERKNLNNMKARYQQYVEEAKSLKLRLSSDARYEEELIARVARGFGESELELPDGFVTEVKRYIALWQQTPRMHQAMARLESNKYAPVIVNALDKEGLPLYFMYLPLQESDYDTHAIGPETRFGIAKGAWQFLATTGQEYG
ncbi:MAG: FHA domain-containing protein, partial [Nitrosomonas sp.]|nr:FHA domain-containing protein [Nitrosomonas sp.]